MMRCVTDGRLGSQHDADGTAGVMVIWFLGYALWEVAERGWRDRRRAIVCGSLEGVALPLTGTDASRRNFGRQGKRAHQNSRQANRVPPTRLTILAGTS
jgi:hypothetical protein